MRSRWMGVAGAVALLAACSGPAGSGTADSTSGTPTSEPTASPSVACPDGSAPDTAGDPTQARPALRDWYLLAAMDPTRPRIIVGPTAFAEGAGQSTIQATWTFDVCTNSWKQLAGALPEGSTPLALVGDTGDDVVLGLPQWLTPVWSFDPAVDAWSTVTPSGIATGESETWPTAVYDPDDEQLLLFDPNLLTAAAATGGSTTGVRAYDPAAHAWRVLESGDPEGDTPKVLMDQADVAYDSAAHRLILVITPGGSADRPARTWAFDPVARTWTQGADMPNTLAKGYPSDGWAVAFDPATARTWWFADTAMLGYDAAADDWVVAERGAGWPESLIIGGVEVDPMARMVGGMVHDPVNGRLVVMAGNVRRAGEPVGGFVKENSLVAADDVWSYEPTTNTWTMLLAPSDNPASYGPG